MRVIFNAVLELYQRGKLQSEIVSLLQSMECPQCGLRGIVIKTTPTFKRYECDNNHRWSPGAKARGRPKL